MVDSNPEGDYSNLHPEIVSPVFKVWLVVYSFTLFRQMAVTAQTCSEKCYVWCRQ